VVTIEDPVEYQHANRSAIIEQIEVGRDTPDFAVTLRSIMRQTPDVILVGEMRDAETMATALTAAETGHLVLSTLHTNDAIQAMSRILDSFPAGNQPQIRQQLSLALAAVIAQQLVPGVDGVKNLTLRRAPLLMINPIRRTIVMRTQRRPRADAEHHFRSVLSGCRSVSGLRGQRRSRQQGSSASHPLYRLDHL